jgi:hypothetical protein
VVELTGKNLAIKTIIFVVVIGYFAYAVFWAAKTVPWIVQISVNPEIYYPPAGLQVIDSNSLLVSFVMEYVGFAGLIVRLFGGLLALTSVFLVLRNETYFSRAKTKFSKALLLEGLYFFSFIPAIYYLMSFSSLPLTSRICLSTALATQLVLISPLLISSSRKLKSDLNEAGPSTSLVRLLVLSCLAYVVAIFVTYALKWVEMSALEGLNWLLSWPMEIAFTNTIITFSLAVVFAFLGTWSAVIKPNKNRALKLWGISAILLSLHLVIFVGYCFSFNAAWMSEFGELWMIPLMGTGIYLLLRKS